MAVSVHIEEGGKPISLLLDFVKVSKSHTSLNLAFEFTEIMKSFGIEEKVSDLLLKDDMAHQNLATSDYLRQCKYYRYRDG